MKSIKNYAVTTGWPVAFYFVTTFSYPEDSTVGCSYSWGWTRAPEKCNNPNPKKP
jgi:hypothetical protein